MFNIIQGTYSNESKSQSCTKCGEGYFQDLVKKTSCTKCEAGGYADKIGSENCTPCAAVSSKYSSILTASPWLPCRNIPPKFLIALLTTDLPLGNLLWKRWGEKMPTMSDREVPKHARKDCVHWVQSWNFCWSWRRSFLHSMPKGIHNITV